MIVLLWTQVFLNCMLSRLLPEYYCLSYRIAILVPIYHEPLITNVVSVSVMDRSIGTGNPHPSIQ